MDPKKARVVFYIMVAGLQELPGLDALLRNVYHVDHFFLVHLDVKVRLHRLCLPCAALCGCVIAKAGIIRKRRGC